jgi:hypothetical protein
MHQSFEGLPLVLLQGQKIVNRGIRVGRGRQEGLQPILLCRRKTEGQERIFSANQSGLAERLSF